jgi:hypothetical protein
MKMMIKRCIKYFTKNTMMAFIRATYVTVHFDKIEKKEFLKKAQHVKIENVADSV